MKDRTRSATVTGQEPVTPEGSTPTSEKREDGQYKDHWVLSEQDRKAGYVRPLRYKYTHLKCGAETRMPAACAETYAADPSFYGSTFCATCGTYSPVGESGEFVWDTYTGEKVGS